VSVKEKVLLERIR